MATLVEMRLYSSVAALATALSALTSGANADKVLDLTDRTWKLQNLPMNISVPGSVPSHVHLDLYKSQVIGNP